MDKIMKTLGIILGISGVIGLGGTYLPKLILDGDMFDHRQEDILYKYEIGSWWNKSTIYELNSENDAPHLVAVVFAHNRKDVRATYVIPKDQTKAFSTGDELQLAVDQEEYDGNSVYTWTPRARTDWYCQINIGKKPVKLICSSKN